MPKGYFLKCQKTNFWDKIAHKYQNQNLLIISKIGPNPDLLLGSNISIEKPTRVELRQNYCERALENFS